MHHHTMERESAHDIVQVALWMSLLRACSGAEAFMTKNQGRVTAQSMVAFLLLEPKFPRSLYYCLESAHGLLRRIWSEHSADGREHASLGRIEALLAWLRAQGSELDLSQIHKLLTHVVDETAAICSHVGEEIQGPQRVAAQSQSQSQSQRTELAE
jgi:uncharacterized alpha-E superfamily protein